MVHYKFESEWALTAPIEEVFELLSHSEDLSGWWPSVQDSRLLEEGDEDGVGRRAAYRIRSPLFYSMSFDAKAVAVDRPNRIHSLIRGDLVGTGTYLLESTEIGTTVRFHWYVSTTKRWMNLVSPIAKRLFVWAHNRVTSEGSAAMAKKLGSRLVSTRTRLVKDPAVA